MKSLILTICLAFSSMSLFSQASLNLDVEGNIRSNSLVGSGDRNVVAQADGTLVSSDQIVKYYSLTGASFQPSEVNSAIDAVTSYQGAYFSTAAPSGVDMIAPIHLPHGSTVTKITIRYKDNDEANSVFFMFGYTNNTISQTYPYFNFNSVNTISGTGTLSSGPITLPIDNLTSSYHFRMVDSNDVILNSNFVIYSVVFEYVE